jgi:hypothetical protein
MEKRFDLYLEHIQEQQLQIQQLDQVIARLKSRISNYDDISPL